MSINNNKIFLSLLFLSAAALAVVGDPGVDRAAASTTGTNGTNGTLHKYWTSEGCSALEKDADSGEKITQISYEWAT